jgi:hypothetical protein
MFPMIRTAAIACLAFLVPRPSDAAGAAAGPMRHLTTRSFPLTLPGTPIIVGKEIDPKTGEEFFVSQSPRVKSSADLVALENGERTAEFAKHGALAGAFRDRYYAMQDSDWSEIRVSLRFPSIPAALDPETHSLSQVLEREREIQAVKPLENVESALAKFAGGLRDVARPEPGVFTCRASKRQIDILRRLPFIGQITYMQQVQPAATYAFSSLASSAYNPASGLPTSFRGQGVNAATLESGLSNSRSGSDGVWYPLGNIVSCLNLNTFNVLPSPRTLPWKDWQHSHQTMKCLWQTAPYANLFHKNTLTSDGFLNANYGHPDNVAFIVNNRIQSTSISLAFSRQLDAKTCPLNYEWRHPYSILPYDAIDNYMVNADEWAFRYPYPVICTPAANWGTDYEANWQCYNALNVGNVRHTGLNHYEIPTDKILDLCEPRASCTQTRNPHQLWGGNGLRPPLSGPDGIIVYNYSSCDREMPYLVAPGISPDANNANMVDQNPTCLDGPLYCGTSYSAPTLNGIVACVLSSDSRMVSRPQVVWATLLATSENVTDGEWDNQFDGKDGAGVVSGASAVNFARNHSEPGPNAAGVVNGIASANISNTTPSGSSSKYNILIPSTKPAGKHLRVVLTWTSNPVRDNSNFLSDLDLSVGSENGFVSSTSYNANVEIVDIPAAQLVVGKTYQATVNLWANRIPTTGVSGGILKYALAWTWVKDHAD